MCLIRHKLRQLPHYSSLNFWIKITAIWKGTGYVLESLEAALWCFWHTHCYADCILAAANLGDDADTTAAVAGQLAGAYYGYRGIRKDWLQHLFGMMRSVRWRSVFYQPATRE